MYRPNVVRIGSEDAPLAPRSRDVWVDGLIRRYMTMTREQWAHDSHRLRQEVMRLCRSILEVQQRIKAGGGTPGVSIQTPPVSQTLLRSGIPAC